MDTAGVAVVIVILVWFGAALVSRVGDTKTKVPDPVK
jgi:hypothetical protein